MINKKGHCGARRLRIHWKRSETPASIAYPPNGGVYLRLIRTLAMDQQTEQCLVMGNDPRMVLRGTFCVNPGDLTRLSLSNHAKAQSSSFREGISPCQND
jgi:hypothetical protein